MDNRKVRGRCRRSCARSFAIAFDLEAGHSLREQVVAALGAPDALIVVCSPHSAKSTVRQRGDPSVRARPRRPCVPHHRRHWRSRRSPVNDCFSDSLRRRVAPDGSLTGPDRMSRIAADARDEGDGKELCDPETDCRPVSASISTEIRKREAIDLRRRQSPLGDHRGRDGRAGDRRRGIRSAGVPAAQRRVIVAVSTKPSKRRMTPTRAARKPSDATIRRFDTTLRLVTTSATRPQRFRQRAIPDVAGRSLKGEKADDFPGVSQHRPDPDESLVSLRHVKALIAWREKRLPPGAAAHTAARLEAMRDAKAAARSRAADRTQSRESVCAAPGFSPLSAADLDTELARALRHLLARQAPARDYVRATSRRLADLGEAEAALPAVLEDGAQRGRLGVLSPGSMLEPALGGIAGLGRGCGCRGSGC